MKTKAQKTVQFRVGSAKLTKKQEAQLKIAAKMLKATGNPTNIIVAKNLKGGLEVLNYLFTATNKAQAKAPKGFDVEPIAVTPTTTKAAGACVAAQWLIVMLTQSLRSGELKKNGKAVIYAPPAEKEEDLDADGLPRGMNGPKTADGRTGRLTEQEQFNEFR